MHKDFVYLDEVIPGVRWDTKYATWDNFTGAPVPGYVINRITGTEKMATALFEVMQNAKSLGYGLLLWDGYRPQRAVDHFLSWIECAGNDAAKQRYYPNIDKKSMLTQGYIASKSEHSRGSAIDLTLYHLATNELLSMGGDFDLMDYQSHHENTNGITAAEIENRKILRQLMTGHGFKSYENEWWHYNLKDEPFPDTYFDFVAV